MKAPVAGPLRCETDSLQIRRHCPGAPGTVPTAPPPQLILYGRPLRFGGTPTLHPASAAALVAPTPDMIRTPWKLPIAPAGAWAAGTTWSGVSVAVSRYATACTDVLAAAVPAASTMPVAMMARTPAEDARRPTRFDVFLILRLPFSSTPAVSFDTWSTPGVSEAGLRNVKMRKTDSSGRSMHGSACEHAAVGVQRLHEQLRGRGVHWDRRLEATFRRRRDDAELGGIGAAEHDPA